MTDYSSVELRIVVAARELKDGESVLVGVGEPNLAANLAKKLQAPNLNMVYESGTVGSNPYRMPLSIGDPCLVTGAKSICSMYEQFAYYSQGGKISVEPRRSSGIMADVRMFFKNDIGRFRFNYLGYFPLL